MVYAEGIPYAEPRGTCDSAWFYNASYYCERLTLYHMDTANGESPDWRPIHYHYNLVYILNR